MNPFGEHLLNVITYLPLAGAVLLLLMNSERRRMIAENTLHYQISTPTL